jgi:uncharacterized membrane protein
MREIYFRYKVVKEPKNSNFKVKLEEIRVYKTRTDFVFMVSMAFLFIFVFNPWKNNDKYLDTHSKYLMYLFGFIILFTSDWNTFISDSTILKFLQLNRKDI